LEVPAADLTVRLEGAEALRGLVVDEAGEPVADAGVRVSWQHAAAPGLPAKYGVPDQRTAESDEEGRFAVEDLPAGSVTLDVSARGFVPAEPRELELPAAGDLTVVLARGGALIGAVATRGGEPIPGFTISVEGGAAGRTDADGRYRVEGVPLGPATVTATHRHYGRRLETVEIESGDNVLDLTFDDGVAVSGRVVDEEGLPLAGALVELAGGADFDRRLLRARSDADGAFRLAPVVDGEYRLALHLAGYVTPEPPPRVTVAGEAVEDLELRPTRGVELAVRLGDASTPPRVDVAVYDAGGGLLLLESRDVDAEGVARLPTVPPGTWRLVVSAPGASAAALTATVPGEPLAVALEPAARLAVRVPSLAASDLVATLTLFGAGGEPYRGFDELVGLRESWPLVAGRAVVDRLPAGPWALRVTTADGRSWSATTATAPGVEVEINLE
ncbi:MAG TPA: carboxypeptidase regulatory-like domain-containing protein, partial [Thermoanaerobaculia bacterium]